MAWQPRAGFRGHINWFPGHMAKATRLIRENLKFIDVVLEIRDARISFLYAHSQPSSNTFFFFFNKGSCHLLYIPFSSRNEVLEELIKSHHLPHVVVLHKADLADRTKEQVSNNLVQT
jgi:ribosome biogenesis GTPase A